MREDFIVGNPLPATPGQCADLLHDVREIRLLMAKEVERMEARESELREHLIATLTVDTGASGLKYRAQIVTKSKPRLTDFDAFTAWMAQTGRFDCIQRRVSDKAVMELIEAGETPPGVEKFTAKEVSITKI